MQKTVEKEIKRIAKELDLDIKVVEAIFMSQFKYLKDSLNKSNDLENKESFVNVRMKYFGTFRFNDKRFDRIWRNKQNKMTSSGTEE